MTRPEISVIVPVYKVELFLKRCVDSILSQTFQEFELILVDDGSPDQSGEICDDYARMDFRVHVIHKKNGGVSEARNTGIAVSKGKYIAFVDSDDYIADNYLQTLFECHCDLPICGQEILDQEGNLLRSIHFTPAYYPEQQLIDYESLYRSVMLYSPYCKLFRGDVVRDNALRFPQGITWGEDGMFVADYLQYVKTLKVLPYSGYCYIKYNSQSSLSTRVRSDIMDMITVSREYCIEKMRDLAPDAYQGVKQICTEDICYNCAYFVTRLLDSNIAQSEKIEILSHFLENKYVQKIISEAPVYFNGDDYVQGASVGPADAPKIIRKYRLLRRKDSLVQKIYPLYDGMPDGIKSFYRKAKQKVRK